MGKIYKTVHRKTEKFFFTKTAGQKLRKQTKIDFQPSKLLRS